MNSEKPTSRNIPLPIQREIRQRCGFGCVLCGLPLYEYDHMLGWENIHRHVAEEITLLCNKHHREKTQGLLPISDVTKANETPYNLRQGVSKPYDLHYQGNQCEAIIGSNRFVTRYNGYGTLMIPISVDDVALLGFVLTDGHISLNLNMFDENNCFVLRIVNNQLFYSASPWDIQMVGRNLIVRDAPRQILVDITFEVPNKVLVRRGRFLRNGVEIIVSPDYILMTNNQLLYSRSVAENCTGGLVVGPHSRNLPCAIRVDSVSRYLGDRAEAIRWAKENIKQTT